MLFKYTFWIFNNYIREDFNGDMHRETFVLANFAWGFEIYATVRSIYKGSLVCKKKLNISDHDYELTGSIKRRGQCNGQVIKYIAIT